MAQIINDMDLGSLIGRQLGTGLGKGLGQVANLKLRDLMDRQHRSESAQAFQGLGIPEEKARMLSGFPESVQKELFKGVREFLPLSDLFSDNQVSQYSPDSLTSGMRANSPEDIMMSTLATSPMDHMVTQYLNTPQGIQTKAPSVSPSTQTLMQRPQETQYRPRSIAEAKQLQQARAEEAKTRAFEEKEDIKARREEWTKMKEKAKVAEESKKRVARMKELVESKQLNRPKVAALINTLKHGVFGLGLDLSSMLTPESQEYEKLIQGFLPEAKAMFGARMTDTDLREFLKGMPDLLKTREGKRRMLYNMDIMSDTAILRKKVGDMIIKEHGGRIPRDLDSLIEERAGKQLTSLSNKFKEGFRKPLKEKGSTRGFLGKGPLHELGRLADLALGKG